MTTMPPVPLEWHPAYRGETWLLDWLNDVGQYRGLADLVLPRCVRPTLAYTDDPDSEAVTIRQTILTRKRAAGPAPYVGRPFHYEWRYALDHVGRGIAGESRIVYDEGNDRG